MREVNLAGVDLNLAPALDALLRRRNVTRAAEDVGLSQPAMSRALARLRVLLNDPVLTRVRGGLVPTPRALALAPALAEALDALSRVIREPRFEPAHMRRTFRVAAADAQTVLLAPPLLRVIRASGPEVDLRFEPLRETTRARIEAGELDLVFAVATTQLAPGAVSERVGADALALAMRRGHPRAARRWTVEDYGEVDHVTVSIFGDDDSEIDAWLARSGVTRRIALRTPYFLAALASVGATDAVTTVSATLARRFSDTFGLALVEPPFPDATLEVTMVGAASRASDPGLRWLRARIREAAAPLEPP
jgi:DNA-binding transcriptional LysR family regulator